MLHIDQFVNAVGDELVKYASVQKKKTCRYCIPSLLFTLLEDNVIHMILWTFKLSNIKKTHHSPLRI